MNKESKSPNKIRIAFNLYDAIEERQTGNKDELTGFLIFNYVGNKPKQLPKAKDYTLFYSDSEDLPSLLLDHSPCSEFLKKVFEKHKKDILQDIWGEYIKEDKILIKLKCSDYTDINLF